MNSALRVVASCALFGAVSACGQTADRADPAFAADREAGSAIGHGRGGEHAALGDVDRPADMSIFHLGSEWSDASGAVRPLVDLGGRVQVVALVYTSCAWACPMVVADLKRIEASTNDVGLVLVSIDPDRDTPDQLRAFASASRLSADNWTLLTGDEDDLLELAAVLGVRYRRISETEFMHSNVLTVLDEEGRIVHRQLELGQVDETIRAIHAIRTRGIG